MVGSENGREKMSWCHGIETNVSLAKEKGEIFNTAMNLFHRSPVILQWLTGTRTVKSSGTKVVFPLNLPVKSHGLSFVLLFTQVLIFYANIFTAWGKIPAITQEVTWL